MLLRRYGHAVSPGMMLAIGQATLLVGLGCVVVGQIILRFSPEVAGFSWMDFFGGFLHGLGGATTGISIVLNVIGLRRFRKKRNHSRSDSTS